MNACVGCRLAESDPHTHVVYMACRSCDARSLATWPEFRESVAAECITPAYRSALQRVFGQGWKEAHTEVRRWAERMKSTPKKAAP